jgi:hypothetical protein
VLAVEPLASRPPRASQVSFDSGIGWRVTESETAWDVALGVDDPGASVYPALSVRRDWRTGRLYLPAPARTRTAPPFPLVYPLDRLVFTSLLAHAGGLVVHGTGIVRDGRGFVFAGTHGAGKSTLARLFHRAEAATLLNDDRVVVRRVDGEWRLFGTPWSGTVRATAAASAPVAAILFIRHGAATRPRRLGPAEAAARLLPRCLHPYWDRAGLEALLTTAGGVAAEVACLDFPFVPRLRPVVAALEAPGSWAPAADDPR